MNPQRSLSIIAHGQNLGDDLLDFIQAGKKMRKWYGEGEMALQDGGGRPEKVRLQ